MANSKMFVYYSKTKTEFISANLPATYTNHIVFIKGDANGNGSCIYTHGMYFANFAELIAAINYVKGVKVGTDTYNAAAGGGYVAFEAVDPSTLTLDVSNGKLQFGLTTEFVNKVNNTATNLGTKDDAADKDGSAFARIANLAALVSDLTGGSTDSIEGQINSAINALRTEITGDLTDTTDAKTIEAINDELNSITTRVGSLETDVNTIKGDYLKSTDKTELDGKITTNRDAIAVLNGNNTVEGSVDKKIKDAIEAFAGTADADNVIENITELLNYVSGVDGSKDLASALAQIENNKGAIETLQGDDSTAGSVSKKVKDAIDAEVERANGAYATKAQGGKADTAYQKPSDGIPKYDLNSDVQTSLDKADTAIQSVFASGYINAMVDSEKKLLIGAQTYAIDSSDTGLAKNTDVKSYVDAQWEWEEL